jgi:hypothetical protein
MASIFKKLLGRSSKYSATVPAKKEYMVFWFSKINSVESGMLLLQITSIMALSRMYRITSLK